jgi:hypothetical protein
MTLLLYAITDAPGDGIDGTALSPVTERGLTAIVGELVDADPSIDRLWEYERLIERLSTDLAILPARFGTCFADQADVRSFLNERDDELQTALARVRGAVELSVQVRWRPREPPPSNEDRGTAYMRGLLERERRVATLRRRLEPLGAVARASRTRVQQTAVAGAYLLDPEQVEAFTERVSELAGGLDDVDVVCTGPWPPYSFVEGTDR